MTLTGPRDLRDAHRLDVLENTIAAGLKTFVEVGEALLEIRDAKLYRTRAIPTFEAYCRQIWKFTDRRARQLIESAEVIKALPSGTMVPVSERQARELAPVLKEHGPEVAAAVMAEASANGPATAETIRVAAEPFRPRLDPVGYHEPKPETASLDGLFETIVPEDRRARMDLDGSLVADGMHLIEVVNRWSAYLTDQDRGILENMARGIDRALGESPQVKRLEVVR